MPRCVWPSWDQTDEGSQFHVSLSPIFLGEGPSVHRLLPNWTTHFPVHVLLVFHTEGRFHCSTTLFPLFHIYDRTSYRTSFLCHFECGQEQNGGTAGASSTWQNFWFFDLQSIFWIVNYFRVFWKVNCRSSIMLVQKLRFEIGFMDLQNIFGLLKKLFLDPLIFLRFDL